MEHIPLSATGKSRLHHFGQETLKRIFFGYVIRAEKDGQAIYWFADCGDLQTEFAEMYITRYQHEEAFIKYLHEFVCANGALKFLGRP